MKRLILFLILGFSTGSFAEESCKGVLSLDLSLSSQASVREYHPEILRNLGFSLENIAYLGEESLRRFNTYYDLFLVLEDSVVLEKIVYSFRDHIFVEEPFRKGRFNITKPKQEDYRERVEAFLPEKSISSQDLVNIWNIEKALLSNLGVGFLEEDILILLSYLLNTKFQDIRFLPKASTGLRKLSVGDYGERGQVQDWYFIKNLYMRKAINRLIRTEKFRNLVHSLNLNYHDRTFTAGVSKIINSPNFSINQNRKSEDVIWSVNLILTYLAVGAESLDQVSAFLETSGIWDVRGKLLNTLEESLHDLSVDGEVVETIVNGFDYSMFATPLPAKQESFLSTVIRAAKNSILGLKEEASLEKARINQEEREASVRDLIELKLRDLEEAQANSVNVIEPRREQLLNPKKRRNNNNLSANDARSDDDIEVGDRGEQFRDLSEVSFEELREKPKFNFTLLRQGHLGSQTIEFSEKALASLEKRLEEVKPILKALSYGYTSKDSQNGVKKILGLKKIQNYYEIKPGDSSFRVVLYIKGNQWKALDFMHKDKIRGYVNKLQNLQHQ